MKGKNPTPNQITTAFIVNSAATKPKGKRAGAATKASIVSAIALGISGVGAAYGVTSGFIKGLVS